MENNQENKKEKLVLLDMKMTFKTIVIKTLRYQCGKKKNQTNGNGLMNIGRLGI